jgi:hypothetical protein
MATVVAWNVNYDPRGKENDLLGPLFKIHMIIYQDRLGTNVANAPKTGLAFLVQSL